MKISYVAKNCSFDSFVLYSTLKWKPESNNKMLIVTKKKYFHFQYGAGLSSKKAVMVKRLCVWVGLSKLQYFITLQSLSNLIN
jgi:hypothetical protein